LRAALLHGKPSQRAEPRAHEQDGDEGAQGLGLHHDRHDRPKTEHQQQ
jgi:hypothetical protein